MTLRGYQNKDYLEYQTLSTQHQHILWGGATGYGKSVIIKQLVEDAIRNNLKVLIIAPRRKLILQLEATLSEYYPTILMGTEYPYDDTADVVIASTPTLNNRLKRDRDLLGQIGLVIVDECHINHLSPSMALVHQIYWNNTKWVGLSATPIDEKGYALEGYDYTLYNYQSRHLIELGALVPMDVMIEDTPTGLDQVKLRGGDYSERELSEFMSDGGRVRNVYNIYDTYCRGHKTLVFAVSIDHANTLYDEFCGNGVACGVVHSNVDETLETIILDEFKYGTTNVLINVGKLTTGYDEGSITAIIMARPTKSLRLWLQCIGRGLRLSPNKTKCLLLDVGGTVKQHGYPTKLRDFKKTKPPRGKLSTEVINEHKEIECPFCNYSTQRKNCEKEVITTDTHVTHRVICPSCFEVIDERITNLREVLKLKLIQDYTNVKHITNKEVSNFIVKCCKYRNYNSGWVRHIANKYREDSEYRNNIKIIYNRYMLDIIKLDTAINNISKLT